MGTNRARCLAAAATVVWVLPAYSQLQSEPELALPAALAVAEQSRPLKLPDEKPTIELASYWRHAKPLPKPNTKTQQVADAGPQTESAPLVQPEWLVPEELTEPPGAAVFIDDAQPSIKEVIQLAIANLELPPSQATALMIKARELAVNASSVGDYGDVLDQCHRALDAMPDKTTAASIANLAAWAHNRRGEVVAERGNEHAAFEDFQEAIRLNPDCWPALHNRGVTLARYAQEAEALADFNRVIKLAPDYTVARYNRGEIFSQMGRWQDAIEDYTRAIEAMPDQAGPYAGRACARHQLGETRAAASDFNTAIRLNQRHAVAYIGRGNLYAAEGLYEQAAADFQQALRLNPRSASAYRSVAWLLATCPLEPCRSPAKAVEAAHRFAKMVGEDDPVVLDTLAAAYAAAGDYRKAISYQQQAIVLADSDRRDSLRQRLALYRQGKPFRTK